MNEMQNFCNEFNNLTCDENPKASLCGDIIFYTDSSIKFRKFTNYGELPHLDLRKTFQHYSNDSSNNLTDDKLTNLDITFNDLVELREFSQSIFISEVIKRSNSVCDFMDLSESYFETLIFQSNMTIIMEVSHGVTKVSRLVPLFTFIGNYPLNYGELLYNIAISLPDVNYGTAEFRGISYQGSFWKIIT